ncbi:efflux RND transporter periplasmic adaptor subunit [Candidatus Fermentibacteria bacterium]|nr:efflux RND transporter periplasmic adaptor subunit [Candidatus Fermentibacteria bacterium]
MKNIVALVVLPALFSGCGGGSQTPEEEALEPSPLPVAAEPVVRDTLFRVVEATGRIGSARTQDMVAQIQGVVSAAPAGEGVPVRSGQAVFRIAAGEQAATLQNALGAQRSAQALYDFECANYEGTLTDEASDMLRRTTGLLQAEADLARARPLYGNAVLSAGFDGVVAEVLVHEGVTVYPGTRLGSVVDMESLEAEVDLDERDLALCRVGARAFITVPSLGDTVITGAVSAVSPVIDPSTRAGRVAVDLPPVPGLRPGATARLEIVTEVLPDQLLVPEEAVLTRDNRPMVFVVSNGRADWRYVTTTGSGRGFVAVADGVSEGEQVITGGHYALAHDAPVAVVER